MSSESELVRGILKRDRQAFSILYDRYGAVTYSILLHVTRDAVASETLLEGLFVSVPGLIQHYDRSCCSLGAWMSLLARNLGVRYIRSTRPATTQEFVSSDGEQQILEMAYFGGCSATEIAEHLDTPLQLIQTRLRAAMQTITNALRKTAV